jgi:hypothetical protein
MTTFDQQLSDRTESARGTHDEHGQGHTVNPLGGIPPQGITLTERPAGRTEHRGFGV